MTNRRAAAFALLALFVVAAPSSATEEPRQMSLDLKEVEVDTILNTFARLMHSRLEKHPSVVGTVTFRFERLSWHTALNAICESAHCEWQLEEGRDRVLRVVADENVDSSDRVNLSLCDASARQVFEVIAQLEGIELELDPTIEGVFTFEFECLRIDTALDALCDNVGCSWSRLGTPARLEIRPARSAAHLDPESPSDRLTTRIDLDLLDADTEEVLTTLARLLDVEPDLPSDLGRVSLDLESQTVGEILDLICEELFLDWRLARNPAGWSLAVMRRKGDFGGVVYQEREEP
jgi:hypothetical protein